MFQRDCGATLSFLTQEIGWRLELRMQRSMLAYLFVTSLKLPLNVHAADGVMMLDSFVRVSVGRNLGKRLPRTMWKA